MENIYCVSIIVPTFNEREFLPLAVASLTDSIPSHFKYEVLVVDGGSSDGTVELVKELSVESVGVIRLLHNPDRYVSYAMNLGIENAKYDIILRADAHAFYHGEYVSNSVGALIRNDGDNVGGVLVSRAGSTEFSRVLSMVLNSRLGSGGAAYREKGETAAVDTVWCGCWYKQTLQTVGGFDQDFITNQDAEMNIRLRIWGFRVVRVAGVGAELVVRESYLKFIHQYFRYGQGRAQTVLKHGLKSLGFRQSAPLIASVVGALLLALQPSVTLVALFALIVCLPIIFLTKFEVRKGNRLPLLWVGPILIGMTIAWASGFAFRLVKRS